MRGLTQVPSIVSSRIEAGALTIRSGTSKYRLPVIYLLHATNRNQPQAVDAIHPKPRNIVNHISLARHCVGMESGMLIAPALVFVASCRLLVVGC